MRSHGDPEAAQDEHPGEEDAGHPAEDEREPGERLARASGVVSQREEQRRARDGQRARQDLGACKSRSDAEEDGNQDQTERSPRKPRRRCSRSRKRRRLVALPGSIARSGGLVCSRYENPRRSAG